MLSYDDFSTDTHEEDATTWIALSDLMTGLMAIFLAISAAMLVSQNAQQVAIVRDVSKALKDKGIDAKPDPKTGDISIPADIAFNFGDATLTQQGKDFLQKFVPVYAEAIFELPPEQQAVITRLVVEGHTDTVGGYSSNMELSTKRANAVLTYIDQGMTDFPYKQDLLKKLTAVGRGESDANLPDETQSEADRNVLFRFTFRQMMFDADRANTGNKQLDDTSRKTAKASEEASQQATQQATNANQPQRMQ